MKKRCKVGLQIVGNEYTDPVKVDSTAPVISSFDASVKVKSLLDSLCRPIAYIGLYVYFSFKNC